MELQKLSLTNFKNIARADLELSPGVNCFLGNNGMGKSNLLDAIYLLSFCKSFTGVNDPLLIRRGETFAMVRGEYMRRGRPEVLSMGMTEGRRKRLKRGDKEYTRLSSHIGQFPLVIIAPQDIALITGSGEERRRWMGHGHLPERRCLSRRPHPLQPRPRTAQPHVARRHHRQHPL